MSDLQPKRPWSGWAYLLIIALALSVGWVALRPVGLGVSAVFQRIIDAFKNGR